MVDLGVKPATNVAIVPLHRGFKLATSTFVLSTLNVYLHSHIPQADYAFTTSNSHVVHQPFSHCSCLTGNKK